MAISAATQYGGVSALNAAAPMPTDNRTITQRTQNVTAMTRELLECAQSILDRIVPSVPQPSKIDVPPVPLPDHAVFSLEQTEKNLRQLDETLGRILNSL